MPVELVKREEEWALMLSGVVDIFDATALHAAAVEAASSPAAVVAGLGAVEALDTATTQVLLALGRALASSGRTLRLQGTPPAVHAFWAQAGLDTELGP
jgi:anti-anti-sigma regulatory factor